MKRRNFLKSLTVLTATGYAMQLNALHNFTASLNSTEKMPVLFLGHGSPMNALELNEFSSGWRSVGKTLPSPNAILFSTLGNQGNIRYSHGETQDDSRFRGVPPGFV